MGLEILNEKFLPCPFCGAKPEVIKEIKFRSSWDGTYLKYPDVWINVNCENKNCRIHPYLLDTLNYRKVFRSKGETREQMINEIENRVITRAMEKWNYRYNNI